MDLDSRAFSAAVRRIARLRGGSAGLKAALEGIRDGAYESGTAVKDRPSIKPATQTDMRAGSRALREDFATGRLSLISRPP